MHLSAAALSAEPEARQHLSASLAQAAVLQEGGGRVGGKGGEGESQQRPGRIGGQGPAVCRVSARLGRGQAAPPDLEGEGYRRAWGQV